MNVTDLLFIGVGLSMDAFAVAVCKGLSMSEINKKQCLMIALFFGGFQALMPFLGWILGTTVVNYIKQVDHWIVFALLLYVGGKMVVEAIKEWNEDVHPDYMDVPLHVKELLFLAIATSIDAFAVGITFSFLSVNIGKAVSIIGLTTFVISGAGVFIGNFFGGAFKNKAQLVGGIILIGIGTRVLITHLMGLA
ncbi:MAG: manganese efflux pump MntP family protein [Lachnospiraceae bacterium]|nr:manganese efflux pump MntP family protein [Lachnospiraceae bacterium]